MGLLSADAMGDLVQPRHNPPTVCAYCVSIIGHAATRAWCRTVGLGVVTCGSELRVPLLSVTCICFSCLASKLLVGGQRVSHGCLGLHVDVQPGVHVVIERGSCSIVA
jgi:hypothetical protein